MKCGNCATEINPTLVYCQSCGAPVETDFAAIQAAENERIEEAKRIEATLHAKDKMILALFLLGAVFVLRLVLLDKKPYDATTAYRAPYKLVEEAGIDPSATIDTPALALPLPDDEQKNSGD